MSHSVFHFIRKQPFKCPKACHLLLITRELSHANHIFRLVKYSPQLASCTKNIKGSISRTTISTSYHTSIKEELKLPTNHYIGIRIRINRSHMNTKRWKEICKPFTLNFISSQANSYSNTRVNEVYMNEPGPHSNESNYENRMVTYINKMYFPFCFRGSR